ncbi:Lon protease [Corynebacterium ulcerans]|uniref:YlbL family protein n=1 Tax=Corynebacterium ulcerans TaxID=65058 RepID=UPI000521136C|nr:PDZ domain-containing protein [Corynebacterium ulcerans]AIU29965.1 Lon protease [Corynebacterium ulcerans]
MKRRLSTLTLGALPIVVLGALVTIDHVPGTDIDLTVPYAAEGPGPTFNTLGQIDGQDVVEIGGADVDKTRGNLNMTTVSIRSGMTLAQALSRWLFTDDTLIPLERIYPKNKTPDQINQENQIAFSSSEASATIAAMNHLGRPVETEVASIVEESAAHGILQEGDVIMDIDGTAVGGPKQVRETVRKKKVDDSVTITYRRDGQKHEATVKLGKNPNDPAIPFLGVSMAAKPAGGITVDYHLKDIGGPSAGLMFSLAVVDKLSGGDLNGGKFVAGTGTIDDDGTVGPIGGIAHKVQAAKDAGAELFLAPAKNCSEAVSRNHDGMTVLSVDSLDDAIKQMDAYNTGGEYTTCKK